jgi:hypothetical protein
MLEVLDLIIQIYSPLHITNSLTNTKVCRPAVGFTQLLSGTNLPYLHLARAFLETCGKCICLKILIIQLLIVCCYILQTLGQNAGCVRTKEPNNFPADTKLALSISSVLIFREKLAFVRFMDFL